MGAEEKGQVKKDAEVQGLSRNTWRDKQEFHVGLFKLPVSPSDGQGMEE